VTRVQSYGAVVTRRRGLQFGVLGPLEASRDGVGLDLGPRKQRAVLALLLLNANRVVATERLIDALWGDSPPESARSALQVYVAGLRKALGSDGEALRTRAPGYVLDVEPDALDLAHFDELRAAARASTDNERRAVLLAEALSLWRDNPLAELKSEPFSITAVAQLEELRLEVLEERIDADLALGRYAGLVSELDALVAEHPYRERLRAQLMIALYGSGRQAEALQTYQYARHALSEELGLRPGQELRDLEAAILRQDESLIGRQAGRRPAAGPAASEPGEGDLGSVTVLFPDGAPELAPQPSRRERRLPRLRRRWAVLLAAALGLLAAAAGALSIRDGPAPIVVPPNSLAIIDPKTDRVVAGLGVGIRPGPIALGGGSLWVGNLDDGTVSRIDPATRRLVRTITLGATPTGLAWGAGSLWVAYGIRGELARVDPRFNHGQVTKTVRITGKSLYYPTGSVAWAGSSVWAVFGNSTLARVDAATGRRMGLALAGAGPVAVVVQSGSIWVSNSGDSTVLRFDPNTFEQGPVQMPISVAGNPSGMAADEGAIWVANTGDDVVTRIDAGSRSPFQIPVGDGPTAVALGAGAVWVANTAAGTVSRIDPKTKAVVSTIRVGSAPSGIVVAAGMVWVAVQAR
jgi:YVTN family beta-propeller protein